MTIYPLQYFGLGDIIFTQTLVRRIANGNPIVWGVLPQFIEGLSRAYPDITWIDYRLTGVDYNCRQDVVIGDKRILPIRWNVEILKVPYNQCMSSKYALYGMDWHEWKEKAQWVNSYENQKNMFDFFVINPKEYNIVNRTFGSNNQFKVPISINNGLSNVEMRVFEPKYSLFDWALTLLNAKEIHTVSTSIIYLLEMLDMGDTPIHIYLRKPQEHNHDNYKYILQSHNYILH